MTFHWAFISNELTQKFFCPIAARRNLVKPSSTVQEAQTFVKMTDIYSLQYEECE